MLQKLKDNFFIDADEYLQVKDEINESNRRGLLVFSGVSILMIIGLIIASISVSPINYATEIYAALGIALLIIFFITLLILPKHKAATGPMVHIFIVLVLLFGILMAVMDDPSTTSCIFVVLIFVAPILFTTKPFGNNAIIIVMTVAFVIVESKVKDPEVYRVDKINAISFMVLSVICSTYLMIIKLHGYSMEHANAVMKDRELERERAEKEMIYEKTYIDALTGVLNRTAYSEEFVKLQEQLPEDLVIISIDTNGLKKLNDESGHKAGDELLWGTAVCMKKAFGDQADDEALGNQGYHGNLYRIGGDEFVVIMRADSETVDRMLATFHDELNRFDGEYVHGISVSCGIVRADEDPSMTIVDLEKLADKRMYDDKHEYYRVSGVSGGQVH